jgi:hypothetical protein
MGTPPPSTVDVDTVIARERRRSGLRRAGLVGFVGSMALGIALVLTLLPRAGTRPTPPIVGANPTTSAPVLTPRQQEALRLTEALTALMAATLPNADFGPNPWTNPPDTYEPIDPVPDPLVFVDRGEFYYASAEVIDAAGRGTLEVSAGAVPSPFRTERQCDQDPPPLDADNDCHVENLAGGSIMMVFSGRVANHRWFLVELLRADGSLVSVFVSNLKPAESWDGETVDRPTPSMTLAQTMALAQEPELTTPVS